MDRIELHQLLPTYFAGREGGLVSDVWDSALTINSGESYLVRASSGRGKSSLCSFLYGLKSSYRGTIAFDGRDVTTYSIARWTHVRRVSLSMLFQELRLFAELTAIENIELKNSLTGYKTRDEILAMMDALGVVSKADMPIGKLSFGEQQRVAFVRALCQPFDFILLDEPVSHLDSDNGAIMASMLSTEASRQGAGVIVTSVGNNLDMSYDNILNL